MNAYLLFTNWVYFWIVLWVRARRFVYVYVYVCKKMRACGSESQSHFKLNESF